MIKNGWYNLLTHNIKSMLKIAKDIIVLKFLKKCPNCYSRRIHFVEGTPKRFEKWFCKDCLVMHYKFYCPHCEKPIWYLSKYKTHIFKEYQLGKFNDKKTFRESLTYEYIQGNIDFHEESIKHWEKIKQDFLKNKEKVLKYGGKLSS